jgi:torulene dioxygenase
VLRFDGFTTTHRFKLVAHGSEGCSEILYSSKMQVEELVKTAGDTGSVGSHVTFGERDPCDSLYRKVKSSFSPSKTREGLHANIGVALRRPVSSEVAAALKNKDHVVGDVLTISTDNSSVKHFDASTLEPLAVSTQGLLHPDLAGQLSAAHACEDPVTGDIFNYNLMLGPNHIYR